jgi:magnesium transporter
VIEHFQITLSEMVTLALFVPLLIGTGGNVGSQTVTTLVRAMGVGEVHFDDLLRVWTRELMVGGLIGIVMGAATFVRAVIQGVGWQLGPVVALTSMAVVMWSVTVAAILPLVLRRLRVDPAVVSAPLITTLVDGTGLFIYFSLARVLLRLD